MRAIGIVLTLLRTIMLTYFTLVIAGNLNDFNEDETLRLVQIFLISATSLLLVFIVYFSSHLYLLSVPNPYLPWSETSPQPFLIGAIFKVFLCLAFAFRTELVFRYALTGVSTAINGYLIFLRLKSSYMFSRSVFMVTFYSEAITLHLLFMTVTSELFSDPQYYLFIIGTLPVTLMVLAYLVKSQKTWQTVAHIEDWHNLNDSQKIVQFMQMLEFFIEYSPESESYLGQIHHMHQLRCHKYGERVSIKLMKRHLKLKAKNQDSHQHLEVPSNQIVVEAEQESPLLQELNRTDMSMMEFPSQQQPSSPLPVRKGAMKFKGQKRDFSKAIVTIESSAMPAYQLPQPSANQNIISRAASLGRSLMNFKPPKEKSPTINEYDFDSKPMKRDKEIKHLLKHFFKHHLTVSQDGKGDSQSQRQKWSPLSDKKQKDFRIHLLKAYFTLKILKNEHLAHFLLFEFLELASEKDGFIERNQKKLHQKLFETMIVSMNRTDDQFQQLNLQNMLDLNQMTDRFENLMETLANDIKRFWQNLYNDKEATTIFQSGVQLSSKLNSLQQLYSEIESKQEEKKEIKIYIQMSAFYKYVVFKQQEHTLELQKTQQVYQNRKIGSEKWEQWGGEKGLILARIDLKKPMDIDFINKPGCNLLQIEKSKAKGMKVNQIMPQMIHENHTRFIDRFMATGKHSLLNKKRKLVIKKVNGYIIPVQVFLCINTLDLNSMIFIFEKAQEDPNVFQENDDNANAQKQYGMFTADREMRMMEMTSQCKNVCKLSQSLINIYRQTNNKEPCIDDLFMIENQSNYNQAQDFQNLLDLGINEMDVTVRYGELLNFKKMIKEDDEPKRKSKEPTELEEEIKEDDHIEKSSKKFLSSQSFAPPPKVNKKRRQTIIGQTLNSMDFLEHAVFTLSFDAEYFLGGKLMMRIVHIKLTNISHGSGQLNPCLSYGLATMKQIYEEKSVKSIGGANENTKGLASDDMRQDMTQSFDQKDSDIPGDFFDVSSCTSTSSSMASLLNKYDLTQGQIEGRGKIPSTLKFVLQIVFLVFLLIVSTSTVSLVLTMSNFKDAELGIRMSNLSIARLNSLTQIRLMMRVLINIVQGYNDAENAIFPQQPQRFVFYTDLIEDKLGELRDYQNQLDAADNEVAALVGHVNLEYLTASASFDSQSRSISQAVTLYVNYAQDIIELVRRDGQQALWSWLVYFYIPVMDIRQASVVERQMYFLIQNANQDMFFKLNKFAVLYADIKGDNIQSKVTFSETMTWICIGVIFLSGVLIIPLFGKIQNRILSLMQLFFGLSKPLKKEFLDRIDKFNYFIKGNKIAVDQKQAAPENQVQGVTNAKSMKQVKGMRTGKRRNLDKTGKKSSHLSIVSEEPSKESQHTGGRNNLQQANIPDFQEEAVSDEENNGKQHKKHRENKDKDNKIEEQAQVQNDPMTQEFQKIISKNKLSQSIWIAILIMILQGYFLGTYFMSSTSFSEMSQSISHVFVLFGRKACAESVIHAVTEGYQWNDTYYINGGQNEIMDYYTKTCFQLENDYQNDIRKDRNSFLNQVLPYLDMLEEGEFCDEVFKDGDGFQKLTVTPQSCATFSGGIALPGLTNIYQTVYKVSQQLQIEYQNAFDNGGERGPQFIYSRMIRIGNFLDVIVTILEKPQQMIRELTVKSITEYFDLSGMYFIIIFAAFMMLAFTIILVFFCKIFRHLKREMLLSNKLIYIIDFEMLTNQEKEKISNFLSKY